MTEPANPPKKSSADVLKLGAEYVPAMDVPDPPLDWLAKASSLAGDAGPYAVGIKTSVGAIAKIREVMFDAQDRRVQQAAVMAPAVNAAAAKFPRDAMGNPTTTGLQEFFVSQEQALNEIIRSEFQDTATVAADVAERTLHELEAQLAAGRRRAEFLTLSGAASPDMVARVSLLTTELDSRPVPAVFDAIDSALRAEPLDMQLCTTMALAVGAWARKKLSTNPARRVSEATASHTREIIVGDSISKENVLLDRMLRMIDEWRVEEVDPALVLASEIFASLLLPVYRTYCGFNSAWDLPKSEADSGKLPSWDTRLEDFLTRFMRGTRFNASATATVLAKRGGANGPPGWSPRVRTKQGFERQNLGNLVANPNLPAKLR
jgi:hypothetical protein